MKVYRYLTGKDDAAFCHRVTDALNRGWQLYGQPTLTFDQKRGEVICGKPSPRTSKARLTIPKWICRSCSAVDCVGWVERSDTHHRPSRHRWVSLRSTHPTGSWNDDEQ
jgi:hypothetical protein